MAEIRVERKSGTNVWAWIIGLIVLALAIWAAVELFTDDEIAPVVTEPGLPAPIAQPAGMTVGDVVGNPTAFVGQNWSPQAEVTVSEVVSDRGFWITDQGNRLFVILNEGPPGTADVQGQRAERPDIDQGNIIRINEGVLRDATFLTDVAGALDARTRNLAQQQSVFLVTEARNIQMVRQQ